MERPKFSKQQNEVKREADDTELSGANRRTIVMDVDGNTTISFKLDEEYIRYVDKMCKELGYTNRSELVRDAVVSYLEVLEKDS